MQWLPSGVRSGVDRFQFVLEVLPGVYTDEVVADLKEKDADRIVKDFTTHAKLLETGISRAKNRLPEAVCQAFGRNNREFKTCQQLVTEWYDSLNPNQQDISQYEDEETSQLVKVLSDKKTGFEDKLMIGIPSSLGFGQVRGGARDQSTSDRRWCCGTVCRKEMGRAARKQKRDHGAPGFKRAGRSRFRLPREMATYRRFSSEQNVAAPARERLA